MRVRVVCLAVVLPVLTACLLSSCNTVKTAPDTPAPTITNPLPSIPSSSANPTSVGEIL